jgi:putative transposase
LSTYDWIALGNWKDSTPDSRRKQKKARKAEFAKDGTKRAKGQAARATTQNRLDRDNALGMFRSKLIEKEKRNVGAQKHVVLIPEGKYKSTQTCPSCSHVTGPKNNTSIRQWTCSHCNTTHDRDVASAQNHLNALADYK